MRVFTRINRSSFFLLKFIVSYHGNLFYLYEGLIGFILKIILYKYTRYAMLDYFVNSKPEKVLIESHNKYTRSGDRVGIIGGGIGVTAIYSSKIVSDLGSVEVFEGGYESTLKIKDNILLNHSKNITVHHAFIGDNIDIYGGNSEDALQLKIKDILDFDVLELDCEGSEYSILMQLNKIELNLPRHIFVEYHPVKFVDYNNFFSSSLDLYDAIEYIDLQGQVIGLHQLIDNLKNGKVSFGLYEKTNPVI
jgi:hypothetical protein